MKDSNEFELCKQVYEATGWKDVVFSSDEGTFQVIKYSRADYKMHIGLMDSDESIEDYQEAYPLYTSDYLLEKLPKELENHFLVLEICNAHNELEWTADYYNHRYFTYLVSDEPSKADTTHGNTPLKALLKLTLKLHEEGLL